MCTHTCKQGRDCNCLRNQDRLTTPTNGTAGAIAFLAIGVACVVVSMSISLSDAAASRNAVLAMGVSK